ncbi:hypothetical protein Glove_476g102 [Diversispora epigaea]|uniref:Uncharacterized protein n=1 Tax=Diversispora epigaea TaxID=1348612 RepID=A0A397GL67_9GLOM|nr:hypothetical protein Glove_476g102 [Diversispora epigaea]
MQLNKSAIYITVVFSTLVIAFLMNGQGKKLYPYQQLFEPKLWLDINAKFLAPNEPISSTILPPRNALNVTLLTGITPILSNIITNEHALEISPWIETTHMNLNYLLEEVKMV